MSVEEEKLQIGLKNLSSDDGRSSLKKHDTISFRPMYMKNDGNEELQNNYKNAFDILVRFLHTITNRDVFYLNGKNITLGDSKSTLNQIFKQLENQSEDVFRSGTDEETRGAADACRLLKALTLILE